jgi:hypothetical protein
MLIGSDAMGWIDFRATRWHDLIGTVALGLGLF